MNPVHGLTLYLFRFNFHIVLPSTPLLCLSSGLFPSIAHAVTILIFRVSPSALYLPPAILFTVVQSLICYTAATFAGRCTSTPAPYCSGEPLDIPPSAAARLVPPRFYFISARQVAPWCEIREAHSPGPLSFSISSTFL